MNERLDPRFHYCAGDFKDKYHADYGAASTHGGHYCTDCKHRRGSACHHPRLAGSFSLGTHPDRMGCRHGYAAEGERRA